MKLLIIRHGEPDYEHDSLTEKGWREAEYLAERLSGLNVKEFCVSPLGRAKATARPTLKRANRTATEYDWLREFQAPIQKPNRPGESIPWDWLPQDWTAEPNYFRNDKWFETEIMQSGHVEREYQWVCTNLDKFLNEQGYQRENYFYRAHQPNENTIIFFCHFGVECVILSHLLNLSPMPLWHGICAAPSSVTTLVTEERREGIAAFRMTGFGDISHLYAHQEPPSFAARFCETYQNTTERHD